MNIRRIIDYTELFHCAHMLVRETLSSKENSEESRMELYCELGRMLCSRKEKGAAVALAGELQSAYPDVAGFSARNVRRMRDFYRAYENATDLMSEALQVGWTQNILIMECCDGSDERRYYLRSARLHGLTKLALAAMIADHAHESGPPLVEPRIPLVQGIFSEETGDTEPHGNAPCSRPVAACHEEITLDGRAQACDTEEKETPPDGVHTQGKDIHDLSRRHPSRPDRWRSLLRWSFGTPVQKRQRQQKPPAYWDDSGRPTQNAFNLRRRLCWRNALSDGIQQLSERRFSPVIPDKIRYGVMLM